MGEPKRADPNFKDHTGMVKCATVFDEVLERGLEDLASSLLSEPAARGVVNETETCLPETGCERVANQ